MEHPLRLAAVVFEPGAPVDAVLAESLSPWAGRHLLGWLQGHENGDGCDCRDIVLRAVHDGSSRKITQDLGTGSTGCRLDNGALAEVAGWLLAGLSTPPELLVLNRFGKTEAEGGGLRAVLEQAIGLDVPVLLAVNRRQLGFWRDYAGAMAEELPCDKAAISAWVADALAQPCSMVKTTA